MIKGFQFINHDPFPMIDIKFDGVSISPKKLVEFAETMRLELEKRGVVMHFTVTENTMINHSINNQEGCMMTDIIEPSNQDLGDSPEAVVNYIYSLENRITELEKERDALTLKCTMLEAEFESALDLTDSICSMNTKKERLATYQQYLTTTTFETTLAKRDIEQQAKGVEDFFGLTEPYISMGKNKMWRIDDVIVDGYVKQLREGVNTND